MTKQNTKTKAVKPETGEKSKYQITHISTISYDNKLQKGNSSALSYRRIRQIRKDPTIALGRLVLNAVMLSGSWGIEADEDVNDDIVAFVKEQFIPARENVVENAMLLADVDFGWVGFEKVFEEKDGKIVLSKLKPLLHDITDILVDKTTGEFMGYRQKTNEGQDIDIPKDKCLHIAFRVEGTQWHGEALIENVIKTQEQWDDANDGAARYDRKIAGSHFVVHYPPGKTLINGAETDNGEIATHLLLTLESSGSISVPNTQSEYVDELNKSNDTLSWKIDILEDRGGRQPTFVDRLKYLDALKLRGLGVPERAVIEGEFGTKAEAGAHIDILILNVQNADKQIVRAMNQQCVDHLLALNFGEQFRGKVRLSSAPIADESIGFLREIYKTYLANMNGFNEEALNIDTDLLKDKLGIPKSKEVAMAGNDSEPLPGSTEDELKQMKDKKPVKTGDENDND